MHPKKGRSVLIEILLINFLILLFPVLIYLIFFENTLQFHRKKIVFLLSAVTMVLCMTFPIQLSPGFIFDLRYIPFILASLFTGYSVAFPLYLILNIYRFIIGGNVCFCHFSFQPLFSSLSHYGTEGLLILALKNEYLKLSVFLFLQ